MAQTAVQVKQAVGLYLAARKKVKMSACPKCGYQENIITCDFRGCQNEAEYEGWYRPLDFAGQPTGLIQKMRVCNSCVKFLIGNSPTKDAPDLGESSASDSEFTPAPKQVI